VPIDCGNSFPSRIGVPKEYDDTAPPPIPEGGRRSGRRMKVRVICYEGYRAEETPRAFLLGERRVDVVRILDRWRGEEHEYVKLSGSDGARYILRYDRSRDEWELQMMEAHPDR
jgi:hypothetical protein